MTPPAMQGPDWEAWLAHPQTQKFVQMLKDSAYDTTVGWGQGHYTSDNPHVAIVNDAEARGAAQAYMRLIESIEDIQPARSNGDGAVRGSGSEDGSDDEGPDDGAEYSPFRRQ
jgi:hypothetical protein